MLSTLLQKLLQNDFQSIAIPNPFALGSKSLGKIKCFERKFKDGGERENEDGFFYSLSDTRFFEFLITYHGSIVAPVCSRPAVSPPLVTNCNEYNQDLTASRESAKANYETEGICDSMSLTRSNHLLDHAQYIGKLSKLIPCTGQHSTKVMRNSEEKL